MHAHRQFLLSVSLKIFFFFFLNINYGWLIVAECVTYCKSNMAGVYVQHISVFYQVTWRALHWFASRGTCGSKWIFISDAQISSKSLCWGGKCKKIGSVREISRGSSERVVCQGKERRRILGVHKEKAALIHTCVPAAHAEGERPVWDNKYSAAGTKAVFTLQPNGSRVSFLTQISLLWQCTGTNRTESDSNLGHFTITSYIRSVCDSGHIRIHGFFHPAEHAHVTVPSLFITCQHRESRQQ